MNRLTIVFFFTAGCLGCSWAVWIAVISKNSPSEAHVSGASARVLAWVPRQIDASMMTADVTVTNDGLYPLSSLVIGMTWREPRSAAKGEVSDPLKLNLAPGESIVLTNAARFPVSIGKPKLTVAKVVIKEGAKPIAGPPGPRRMGYPPGHRMAVQIQATNQP